MKQQQEQEQRRDTRDTCITLRESRTLNSLLSSQTFALLLRFHGALGAGAGAGLTLLTGKVSYSYQGTVRRYCTGTTSNKITMMMIFFFHALLFLLVVVLYFSFVVAST